MNTADRDGTNETPLFSRRAALALPGLACFWAAAQPDSGGNPTPPAGVPAQDSSTPAMVAFVLRHCETGGDNSSDPVLSRFGRDRAARVGAMLRSVGVHRILHTATARSRETAMEISTATGVAAGSYDAFDAEPVTKRMVERGGVWIVVGHSNTVPEIVRKLGGDPSADVLPESVYDRVYMVVRAGGGVMTVVLHS